MFYKTFFEEALVSKINNKALQACELLVRFQGCIPQTNILNRYKTAFLSPSEPMRNNLSCRKMTIVSFGK